MAALKAAGAGDVAFVTHELTDDRRALLRAREVHAVVDQDTSAEVGIVADAMGRFLGRLDGSAAVPPPPVRIYTAENC